MYSIIDAGVYVSAVGSQLQVVFTKLILLTLCVRVFFFLTLAFTFQHSQLYYSCYH